MLEAIMGTHMFIDIIFIYFMCVHYKTEWLVILTFKCLFSGGHQDFLSSDFIKSWKGVT